MISEHMFYIDKVSTFQRSGQKCSVNKNWEIYFIRAVLYPKNTVKYKKIQYSIELQYFPVFLIFRDPDLHPTVHLIMFHVTLLYRPT